MAIDTDILKTLESIEELLKGASVLSKSKPLSASQQKNQQSKKDRADKEVTKAFKAVAGSTKDTNDALLGLNKALNGLSGEVGRTTTGFGSLNAQIARFAQSLQPVEQPQPQAQAPAQQGTVDFTALQTQVTGLTTQFGALGGSLAAFNTRVNGVDFGGFSQGLNAAVTPLSAFLGAAAAASNMPNVGAQAAGLAAQFGNAGTRTQQVAAVLQNMRLPLMNVLQQMVHNFGTTALAGTGLGMLMDGLGDAVKKLTVDFFQLSRVGLGSYTNLYTLSKNAFLAGMSLKEYQEQIKENITVAARAGTLDNLDKISSAADSQLASMGIFGSEARALQMSLANSNTLMGVSQQNLTAAISGQVGVFDKLRKSTNMTAAEFGNLVKELGKQEQVQKELVGLAPQQRLARNQELLQIRTTGERLGLAADESKALADALIKQRGETVKSRFEQAGRVRQLAAFAGRGAEGERAAQIIMKGRAASAAELEELRTIAGSLDSATQSIYEQGSLGAQNVVDVLGDTLNGKAFGDLMKANRPAELADVAKVNQEAFGKHVDKFGQFVGEALKYVRGFNESVLPSVMTAIGGGLLVMFRGPISRVIASAVGGVSGAIGAGGAAATAAGGAAGGIGRVLSAPLQAMRGALSTLATPITAVTGHIAEMGRTFNTVRAAMGSGQAVLQTAKLGIAGMFSAGGAIGTALNGFLRFAGPLAAGISAVMELFTGELTKAMDPEGGIWSRIGGAAIAALSAVPQMIIDGLGFIFGDNFMKPIQSVFDTIKVGVMGAINGIARVLIGGVSFLTDLLPKDSGLRKMIDAAKDSLDKSLEANANTINELGGLFGSENRKTLKEIGEANEKAAADGAKKSDKAVAVVKASAAKFNNVQYGTAYQQADAIADAKALLGSPQVQTPKAVTPATVNTPETETPSKPAAAAAEPAQSTEMMSVLNMILQVLKDSLTEEQKQALLAEQLLARSRPSASFTPAEVTANRLLNQGYVAA